MPGMAQTTKPSTNNSPRKQNEMIGPNLGSNSLIKRQQHMSKQKQIGQPMGDIPLKTQYFSFKNNQPEFDLSKEEDQKKNFA